MITIDVEIKDSRGNRVLKFQMPDCPGDLSVDEAMIVPTVNDIRNHPLSYSVHVISRPQKRED